MIKTIIQKIATSKFIYKLFVRNSIFNKSIRTNQGLVKIEKTTKFIQSLLYFNLYERKEKHAIEKYLIENIDVIELGACLGYITLAINNKAINSNKIIAIEANPNAFNNLENTIQINNISKTKCINAAMSYNSDGYTNFLVDSSSLGSHISDDKRSIKVKTMSLEEIWEQNSLGNFCLVCDIEGAEYQFIDNIDRTWFLANCKLIIIEVHNAPKGSNHTLLDLSHFFTSELGFEKIYNNGDIWVLKNINA